MGRMGTKHWKTIGLAALGVSTLSVGLALGQPAHRGAGGQRHNNAAQTGQPGGGRGGQQGGGQGGGGGGGGGGQQGGGDQAGPTSRPSLDQLFDEADTDHDGSLSRDEFKAFIKSHRAPRPGGRGGNGGGGGGGGGGSDQGGNDRPPPPPQDNQ